MESCVFALLIMGIYQIQGLSHVNVQNSNGGVVEVGNQIRLECDYFLDPDESVLSVLWLWSDSRHQEDSFEADEAIPNDTLDQEAEREKRSRSQRISFYRYRPGDSQPKQAWSYHIRGKFTVDLDGSTADSVLVSRATMDAAGVFTCEVVASPLFDTQSASEDIRVVKLPHGLPDLQILNDQSKLRYQIEDTIELKCTSTGSIPRPNITWQLNGDPASWYGAIISERDLITHQEHLRKTSVLKFTVLNDLVYLGTIKIRCVVSMFHIYQRSNEISVETLRIVETSSKVPAPLSESVINELSMNVSETRSYYGDVTSLQISMGPSAYTAPCTSFLMLCTLANLFLDLPYYCQ